VSDTQARLDEIRFKLRSVNVEADPSDDLEYASDLDFVLAELERVTAALAEANENRMFASQMIADYREGKERAEAELERVTAAADKIAGDLDADGEVLAAESLRSALAGVRAATETTT
jgi:uncharacterized protein YlxW (UPF0749 family)